MIKRTIYIPRELDRKLKRMAKGKSYSSVVSALLMFWFKRARDV